MALELKPNRCILNMSKRICSKKKKSKERTAKKIKKALRKRSKEEKTKVKKRPYKRVSFANTQLGRFLTVNAPFEYKIICDALNPDKMGYSGAGKVVKVVESIAYATDNPAFRTPEFRMALISFRRRGFRPRCSRKWSIKDAVKASEVNRGLFVETG